MTILNGEVWIGLVEVTGPPTNRILEGGSGAFVPYVVFAADAPQYERLARQAAEER
jgi:hypothetical protein